MCFIFAKTWQSVRPGGLVVMLVSEGLDVQTTRKQHFGDGVTFHWTFQVKKIEGFKSEQNTSAKLYRVAVRFTPSTGFTIKIKIRWEFICGWSLEPEKSHLWSINDARRDTFFFFLFYFCLTFFFSFFFKWNLRRHSEQWLPSSRGHTAICWLDSVLPYSWWQFAGKTS